MSLDPLTALLDIGKTALDKFVPDPQAKAQAVLELEEFREYGAQTSANVWALAKAANYLTRFAYNGNRADDYAEVVLKGVSICYDGVDAKDAAPNFNGLGIEA